MALILSQSNALNSIHAFDVIRKGSVNSMDYRIYGKPYSLGRKFITIKNAGQEEEGKIGVMESEGRPGLQLPFRQQ